MEVTSCRIHLTNTGPYSSNYDAWLMKVKSDGTIDWSNAYGGTGNDYGYSVVQTSNGGYVIAGNIEGDVLVKTDSQGYGQGAETYEDPLTWAILLSELLMEALRWAATLAEAVLVCSKPILHLTYCGANHLSRVIQTRDTETHIR